MPLQHWSLTTANLCLIKPIWVSFQVYAIPLLYFMACLPFKAGPLHGRMSFKIAMREPIYWEICWQRRNDKPLPCFSTSGDHLNTFYFSLRTWLLWLSKDYLQLLDGCFGSRFRGTLHKPIACWKQFSIATLSLRNSGSPAGEKVWFRCYSVSKLLFVRMWYRRSDFGTIRDLLW